MADQTETAGMNHYFKSHRTHGSGLPDFVVPDGTHGAFALDMAGWVHFSPMLLFTLSVRHVQLVMNLHLSYGRKANNRDGDSCRTPRRLTSGDWQRGLPRNVLVEPAT